MLPAIPNDCAVYRLRLEIVGLRGLMIGFQDAACLERATVRLREYASLEQAHELEYAQIRTYEGIALFRLNRVPESLERLHAILTALRAKPDSLALAHCSGSLSSAYIALGDWPNARRHSLEALVSARRVASHLQEGVALANLCIAERGRCRFIAAEEAGIEAAAAYERAGAVIPLAHVRRSLAIAQLKRGKVSEAVTAVRQSLSDAAEFLDGPQLWYGKLVLALAYIHLGDPARAVAELSLEFYTRGEVRESRPELLRLEYLGDVELEQGNAEAALKRYDEVLPHALALIPRGDVVAELRRRRAECLGMLGQPQPAHDEAKEALALCLELGDRYEEAATYRTLALTAAALGRHDDAKKHFDHGFAMYDDIETPYEWGKLWMSYGDWLSGPHAGAYESLDGAREAYRAACDHFERMGAELKLTHARQRMAALELRMREEGVDELTPGEKPRPRRRPSMDREMQRRVQWAHDTFGLVTRHRPLLEMLEQVASVAVSDIPVLVLGESGTGKELIARGVHALSGRTGRLVEVNCSAVPTTMMEAEFFGSVHGSYTGSTRDRAGLFEESHEGSVFMDEIGEMPVDLQAKLLRFLETGEVRRIGATTGRTVDARLIAATNRDAAKLQSGEGFRQDLYYRLAHAVFTLPPLRTRGDDVTLLVDHFLDAYAGEARKRLTLSRAARERLTSYSWPGNIRQLRALIQRLVVQSSDGATVTPRDIPLAESAADAPRSFLEEMEGQEKTRIVEALEKTQYIKADAARILRMSRTTLLGKMKRYQIPG
jgi:transcriptional regulator with AAA-type ATPase domain/tetratricopeptide (TPR) repeat protein